MPRRSARPARSARRPKRVAEPAFPPVPSPIVPRHVELREPPHAHSVCRSCGRIAEVSLSGLDAQQLTSLASEGPPEWVVDGISLSMTGLCPKCRRGAAGP